MKRWRQAAVLLSQGAAVRLSWHGGRGPSTATLGLIGFVVCVPIVAAVLIVIGVRWTRSVMRRRRHGEARLRAAARVENGARARMSELCPHGWRAQLTLFGPNSERPPDAPSAERSAVALDWAELEGEDGRVAVERRVWAASIGEALEAMIADRQTDETLERIERSASTWPEGDGKL